MTTGALLYSEHHYFYKITNLITGHFYLGKRSCRNCLPCDDTKYWGSSKYLKDHIKEYGSENFIKEILKHDFLTAQEALEWEEEQIWKHGFSKNYERRNPLMINRCVAGKSFSTYGIKKDPIVLAKEVAKRNELYKSA